MANINTNNLTELATRIFAGVATEDELNAAKLEDVRAIKSDTSAPRRRLLANSIPKTIDREARTVQWVASEESPDRVGDIIEVDGWDVSNWMTNPLILRNHDHDAPLGLGVQVGKRLIADTPKALLIDAQLFTEDKLTELDRVFVRLVLDGDLKGSSVSFVPLQPPIPSDDDVRDSSPMRRYGMRYPKVELLEHSVATIPMHPNAVMRKLDALVDQGLVAKSLAAMAAKSLEPSTRVAVAVGGINSTDGDGLPAEMKRFTDTLKELRERVLDNSAALAQLTTSLTGQLAAVKAQLDRVTRAGHTEALKPEPATVAPNAETDSRVRTQAIGEKLLDAAVSAVKRSGPRGADSNGSGNGRPRC